MNEYIKKVKILKEWDSWIIYDCNNVSWIYRKAWSIIWPKIVHKKNKQEFLMQGKIKLTIEWKIKIVEAPIELIIPAWINHIIEAITDFIILKNLTD